MTTATSNGTATATPRTKICVFCGSSPGKKPEYVEAARTLARAMAANDIDLGIYAQRKTFHALSLVVKLSLPIL